MKHAKSMEFFILKEKMVNKFIKVDIAGSRYQHRGYLDFTLHFEAILTVARDSL